MPGWIITILIALIGTLAGCEVGFVIGYNRKEQEYIQEQKRRKPKNATHFETVRYD